MGYENIKRDRPYFKLSIGGLNMPKQKTTHLQDYILKEKTRICKALGLSPNEENFSKLALYDRNGRADDYWKGMNEGWGKWNDVNNKILRMAKPERGGIKASEINKLMREAGV